MDYHSIKYLEKTHTMHFQPPGRHSETPQVVFLALENLRQEINVLYKSVFPEPEPADEDITDLSKGGKPDSRELCLIQMIYQR